MKISNTSIRCLVGAALAGVGLLVVSQGAGAPAAWAAAPQPAATQPTVSAPLVVYVEFQASVPSTGVVRQHIEPADGSIAVMRQAHQAPLLIVRGVAKGQAKLILEYSDGHVEEKALDVRLGTPPDVETVMVRVGHVYQGKAPMPLKSFSAGVSGIVEVQVAPNGQDYIIRAIKRGHTSVLLIQDNGSTLQKQVDIVP
jgi:hypothetical protein